MINSKSVAARSAMSSRTVVDALRRDAMFIWNVLISAVFVAFAALAVASALIDLISIRH
ncbi:hypothetical protein [Undibacter mobilis]|uniref:hypothetical protein n=1 Tax=Undibacter mobilis TaxID=2292256 RepID=UPI00143D0A3B|nr:hypothetical protein [Undibacter mobilis]